MLNNMPQTARKPQRERVLEAIKNAGDTGIYTWQFFQFSPPILRPASRIDELRKLGYHIRTIRVKQGNFKYVFQQRVVEPQPLSLSAVQEALL